MSIFSASSNESPPGTMTAKTHPWRHQLKPYSLTRTQDKGRGSRSSAGAWTKEKAKDFIRRAKSDSVCADCKKPHPFWVMDFDHRPGEEKLFELGALPNETYDKSCIKREMAKCDVVCSNCHRNRTYMRLHPELLN